MAVVGGQYDNMSGPSEEKEKITKVMEEVASIHGLLSRTNLEISSFMALPPIILFVYNTL